MLGRLAKRLRLLGFDVLYDPTLDDNKIIHLALEQDRKILTRDTALSRRPLAANHLFITHDRIDGQLREVFALVLQCPVPRPLTRCSLCNTKLERIVRQEVRDRVPSHVYQTHTEFFQCPECGRIYWKGTHIQRMVSAGLFVTSNQSTGENLAL